VTGDCRNSTALAIIQLSIDATADPQWRTRTTAEYDAGRGPWYMRNGKIASVRDDFVLMQNANLPIAIQRSTLSCPGGKQHVSVVDRSGGGGWRGGCDGGPDRVA
jgi:hypothetical protein